MTTPFRVVQKPTTTRYHALVPGNLQLYKGLRGAVPKHSPLTAAAQVRSLGWYVGKLSPLLADVQWFSFGLVLDGPVDFFAMSPWGISLT